MTQRKMFRLVTRSDFDGLVCAMLLRELGMLDDVMFAHPKDIQDGKIQITEKDIIANLPYAKEAHLVFDHHASEGIRIEKNYTNHIFVPSAPSAARIIYNYFNGAAGPLAKISEELMAAVDQAGLMHYGLRDVLYPAGWVLLNYVMDARTGLGRFKNFRISNYKLMLDLIEYCREYNIDEILNIPDVKERVDLYFAHEEKFKEQLRRCSTIYNNLLVVDLRREETIYCGNRFMVYALYPGCNAAIRVLWGLNKQNTVLAMGTSIINRTSNIDVGKLMLRFGGGGHTGMGTCQIKNTMADEILQKIIMITTQDGKY